MTSIKNPIPEARFCGTERHPQRGLALMFLGAIYSCTLPDVHVKSRSQSESSQRSGDDGGRPPAQDADAAITTESDSGASSTNTERSSSPDAAVDSGTARGGGAAGDKAKGSRTPATGGRSGSAGDNTAGAAGCSGSSCSECSDDEDCEQRGIAGGKCRNSQCAAPPPQCQSDNDCLQLGPEYSGGKCESTQCVPNPRWRCKPTPTASATDTRELSLPVIDALQLAPLANAPIVACGKLDHVCMQPLATATTGRDGKATLTVPANFDGYMQATERSDYTPALYFMPAQLPDDGVLSNFPLIAASAFGGLTLALGTSVDRERGHAMLIVEDCEGAALGGISFTSPQADKATTPFYIRDQIPTTSATDTPPEGDGGYANMPAGIAEITATDKKTGLVLNTVTVLIRAGFSTTVYIRPAARGTNVAAAVVSNLQ